jgi:hypothetical protein
MVHVLMHYLIVRHIYSNELIVVVILTVTRRVHCEECIHVAACGEHQHHI